MFQDSSSWRPDSPSFSPIPPPPYSEIVSSDVVPSQNSLYASYGRVQMRTIVDQHNMLSELTESLKKKDKTKTIHVFVLCSLLREDDVNSLVNTPFLVHGTYCYQV